MKQTTLLLSLLVTLFSVSNVRASASVKPGSNSVRVDTSASAGAVDLSLSSSAHATYGATGAFDGVMDGSNGRWLAVKDAHMFVTYHFNVPTRVNTIKLYNPNANMQDTRPPKTWTFEGSNDGETWTVLDERTGETGWGKSEVRTYWFPNDAEYAYYKFDCTAINGATDYLMLWEIEFYVADAAPLKDLTTTTSGSVTASSATHKDYPASKAFDGNRIDTNGRWLATRADNMYLVYHFKQATVVNAISVFNGSDSAGGWDSAGRAPLDWTFSGSNDGETWTVLDTQIGENGWSKTGEERYYAFENQTAYEYYKFNCTALNDAVSIQDTGLAGYLQIWELEFYGEEPEPLTLDQQLARFLAPKGYTNVLEVALDGTTDWAKWLGRTSEGYTNFVAAAAGDHAKAAIVFKITGDGWWFKQQLYYDTNGSDYWYFYEPGNAANTLPDGPIYRLSDGGKQTGTPFSSAETYVVICDLPDFENHTELRGAFWNKAEFHLYVLHPNGKIFYAVKPVTAAPAMLELGKSAPYSAIVYDQVTGTEYPDIPIVYTLNSNLSYIDGIIRAKATGTGTIEAKVTVGEETASHTSRVSIPMPNLGYYQQMGTWEFDATAPSNWWLPITVSQYEGLSTGFNYDMAVIKIEYDNNTSASISSGLNFYLNGSSYSLASWDTYPAGTHVTKWLGIADAIPSLTQLVFNFNVGLHVGRITVYEPIDATVILLK